MGISLEKRVEAVGIQLAKHNITQVPPVRVGLALDVSGSAKWMYEKGIMQETVNRLQAIALKFDDNGELDMWTFSSAYDRIETASAKDYDGYVRRNIMENRSIKLWGGTNYAPVIQDMMSFWYPSVKAPKGGLFGMFGKKDEPAQQSNLPAMGLIVTDGENYDKSEAARVLKESANTNVYWQMVGVGDPSNFRFIEEQADLLPNVGFVSLASLEISDEDLYSQLIAEEFCGWIKQVSTK